MCLGDILVILLLSCDPVTRTDSALNMVVWPLTDVTCPADPFIGEFKTVLLSQFDLPSLPPATCKDDLVRAEPYKWRCTASRLFLRLCSVGCFGLSACRCVSVASLRG